MIKEEEDDNCVVCIEIIKYLTGEVGFHKEEIDRLNELICELSTYPVEYRNYDVGGVQSEE